MSERTISAQKDKIIYATEQIGPAMRDLALSLHQHPELSFEEHRSAAELIEPLRAAGFAIETGTGGLETAFRASWRRGKGGPTIALLAEYDALPELGHACGHNLIGTASVAAALALKAADVEFTGCIEVIGTPAEEDGGGKIIMVEKGVFEGVDAVMMFHPREKNMVLRAPSPAMTPRLNSMAKRHMRPLPHSRELARLMRCSIPSTASTRFVSSLPMTYACMAS